MNFWSCNLLILLILTNCCWLAFFHRLKQQADINNWLTDWVEHCLRRGDISYKGKVQLLSGYYGRLETNDIANRKENL